MTTTLPRPDGDGWIEKPWGWARCLSDGGTYEVWEGVGQAGRRTSMHEHPGHAQELMCVSGHINVHFLDVVDEAAQATPDEWATVIAAGTVHELRFVKDSVFIEVYTGYDGTKVQDTKKVHYQ